MTVNVGTLNKTRVWMSLEVVLDGETVASYEALYGGSIWICEEVGPERS